MSKRKGPGRGAPKGNQNAKKREEDLVKNRVKVKYLFGQRYRAEYQEDLLRRLHKSKWPSQRQFLGMCFKKYLFSKSDEEGERSESF